MMRGAADLEGNAHQLQERRLVLDVLHRGSVSLCE